MPTENAVIIGGITLVFVIYMLVLAWASYYTRDFRAPGAEN